MQEKIKEVLGKRNDFISKFLLNVLCNNSSLFQFLRYCVVGGVAFVFDYGALQLAMLVLPKMWHSKIALFSSSLDVSVMIATAIGFVVGLIVNYILSLFFVFTADGNREKGKKVSSMLVFALVGIVGLILTEIGMQLGAAVLGTQPLMLLVAKIVVTLVVLIWNYLGRKIFIFK